MKPMDLTQDIFLKLLKLYRKVFWGPGSDIDKYIKHPGLLYSRVLNMTSNSINDMQMPIDYIRIGSKYSEDTKLGFHLTPKGDIEVLLYLHPEKGQNSAEEQIIEDRFIFLVNEMLKK